MEGTLLVLLLILFVGLVVPELFRKLRLPFVTSLILVGAFFGPHGMALIEVNETVEFFGFLGLTFLMFMAGLETRVDQIQNAAGRVIFMALVNGGVPAVAGFFVAQAYGYSFTASMIVAVIFTSSSIALIIPSLKSAKLFKKADGQLIVSAVVFEDVMSLILLGVLLQSYEPITTLPLYVYFTILIASVAALKFLLPRISRTVMKRGFFSHAEHEDHLRFIIVLLMGALLFFDALGMHPIVGAFLLGLILSGAITTERLTTQLHTLGYGLFVPVFFFLIGTQMDLGVFFTIDGSMSFLIVIVLVSILTKLTSGYVAGRLAGIKKEHALMFGIASTTQLTTSLAASQAAFSLGIIDVPFLTSMVVLSIVTAVFSPIILKLLGHT